MKDEMKWQNRFGFVLWYGFWLSIVAMAIWWPDKLWVMVFDWVGPQVSIWE